MNTVACPSNWKIEPYTSGFASICVASFTRYRTGKLSVPSTTSSYHRHLFLLHDAIPDRERAEVRSIPVLQAHQHVVRLRIERLAAVGGTGVRLCVGVRVDDAHEVPALVLDLLEHLELLLAVQ